MREERVLVLVERRIQRDRTDRYRVCVERIDVVEAGGFEQLWSSPLRYGVRVITVCIVEPVRNQIDCANRDRLGVERRCVVESR